MDYRKYLNQKKKEKVARNFKPLILNENSKINIIEVVSGSPTLLKASAEGTVFTYKNQEGNLVFAKRLWVKTTIIQKLKRA